MRELLDFAVALLEWWACPPGVVERAFKVAATRQYVRYSFEHEMTVSW